MKEYLNRSEPQNQPIAVSQPTRQFFCAQSRKGKIIKCIYSILSFKTQQSIAGKLRSSKGWNAIKCLSFLLHFHVTFCQCVTQLSGGGETGESLNVTQIAISGFEEKDFQPESFRPINSD